MIRICRYSIDLAGNALNLFGNTADQITDFLSKNTVIGNYSLLRIDTVGPTIGKELRKKSIKRSCLNFLC